MSNQKNGYMIIHEVTIEAPVERCFDLTRSIEFHERNSILLSARAVGGMTTGLSGDGDETEWSARFFGIPFTMTTRVSEFRKDRRYRESVIAGLPKKFAHNYSFESIGSTCVLTDSFEYQSGFGLVGKVADILYMRSRMSFLVQVRLNYIKSAAESGEWRNFLD